MVGFHRCSFTGSVFFVAPFRGLARPGCRLHSTVVATYLSGEQDGDSDTDFRARNASQRPVMAGWWTPATSWWNIGETLVKHMRLFQPVFFLLFRAVYVVFFITASVVEARFRFRLCWNPRPNSSGLAGKSPIQFVDFPSYKAPFIVDFQLPCLITRG